MKRKERMYYFESPRGCGLRMLSVNNTTARRALLREVGTYDGIRMLRVATKKDVAWVQGMGGYVPNEA